MHLTKIQVDSNKNSSFQGIYDKKRENQAKMSPPPVKNIGLKHKRFCLFTFKDLVFGFNA